MLSEWKPMTFLSNNSTRERAMQQAESNLSNNTGMIGKWAVKVLSISLLMLMPVAAVGFLGSWNLFSARTGSLAQADDPLANGLRIVEPPHSNASPSPVVTENSEETVTHLQNWTYTDENGSSRR
jgi:hypothetical protein